MEFNADSDPAAEFLAREQDQLAGIGDDIIPPPSEPAVAATSEPAAEEVEEPAPAPAAASVAPTPVPRIEPEKIRRWREEQKKRLDEKDAEEEQKKNEWREAAKKELEDWYKQHEETVAKTRSANRAAEKELVSGDNKSTEAAADWEQIAKLCEFNPKVNRNTKDTSRMRGLILQLKQNPPVKAN